MDTKGTAPWIIVTGVCGSVVLLLFLMWCLCRCCTGKKKASSKKGAKGYIDISQVQQLGLSYKEKVQPDLNELKENMEENEDAQHRGRLHYSLDYDFNRNELSVGVMELVGLPPMDVSGTTDPYVKVYLNPDKKKFETKVHRKTLNPVFNETFQFKIAYSELSSRSITFVVIDFDRFSKHDVIGQVKVGLASIDFGTATDRWEDVGMADFEMDKSTRLGDICFSLRYVPTAAKLVIVILEAKNLKKMDISGLSDPYVKVTLYIGGKKVKKKKSTVKKRTLNPYFNESFTFEVTFDQIQKASLVITVMDYDKIGFSDPMGQVVVSSKASGTGLRHWSDMLANPRRPIAQWHELQEVTEKK
ncbi:synaptotagmin 1d [Helobdella robusta]|uniref:Synaptotagmin 1d n=1 Tax=Helobdella robusta TaxID=6412 RepID=T1ETY8_HELRO|nr:synaptotagmin 1d [Helobdella robusta]ESN96320.1 synaptotagmin 1d [Helobdella robusta]